VTEGGPYDVERFPDNPRRKIPNWNSTSTRDILLSIATPVPIPVQDYFDDFIPWLQNQFGRRSRISKLSLSRDRLISAPAATTSPRRSGPVHDSPEHSAPHPYFRFSAL